MFLYVNIYYKQFVTHVHTLIQPHKYINYIIQQSNKSFIFEFQRTANKQHEFSLNVARHRIKHIKTQYASYIHNPNINY